MQFWINCSLCSPGKYQRVQGAQCETFDDPPSYLGLGIGLGLAIVFMAAAVFGYYFLIKAQTLKKTVLYDSIESKLSNVGDSEVISGELFNEQGGTLDLGPAPDFASRLSPQVVIQAELCIASRNHSTLAAT
jgi:hypothetical protein